MADDHGVPRRPPPRLRARLVPAVIVAAVSLGAVPAPPASAAVVLGPDLGPLTSVTTRACTTLPILSLLCPPATTPQPTPAPPAPATPAPSTRKPCPGEATVPTAATLPAARRATLCLLNRQRKRHHLRPLRSQARLGAAATAYAGRLVAQRFFAHVAPDGSTLVDRVRSTSYLTATLRGWVVGENIAYGTVTDATPAVIVRAWMASPEHRANILRARFRDIGLGIALGSPTGDDGATYVNDFGRRTR